MQNSNRPPFDEEPVPVEPIEKPNDDGLLPKPNPQPQPRKKTGWLERVKDKLFQK